MAERARIAHYFAPLTAGESGSFSLADDAAVLTPPNGQQLVVTTDSVIESIHVLTGASAQQFAQKLMRRNLSDLAAMGASPWRYTINLHTPRDLPEVWFAEFATALKAEQEQFGLVLIGGDSTSGGASIHCTMTCFGLLTRPPLTRSGAKVGDDVYVSGTIGDAALGLKLLQQHLQQNSPLITRYHLPQPRLALGLALHGMATAAIDISDGLLADVAQLCGASGVGARIMREAIPLSNEAQQMLVQDDAKWQSVLNGGDDYELCFAAPEAKRADIAALAESLGLALTRIGTITRAKEIVLLDANGAALPMPDGWEYA